MLEKLVDSKSFLHLHYLIEHKFLKPLTMNVNVTDSKGRLKKVLKSNIAKAWYQLDKKSYESWLEGRKANKTELNY